MLMIAVVLPDAFAGTHFADPSYHLNTEMFLRGIESNGLILVDAEKRLYHELCDTVAPLAQLGKGKHTHVLFEEILKNRKVLRFVTTCCSVKGSRPTAGVATQVVQQCGVDVLLVDPVSHPALASYGTAETTVISVPDYGSSPIEAERRRCCEKLPPMDQVPAKSFDDLIMRCTRYSRWLRLFDKQIGKGKTSHFRRGIERILQLWIKAAHFPKDQLHVEIFTVVDDSNKAELPPSVAYHRVKGNLVEPLMTDLGLRIDLHFKKDEKDITHPRHLQTQCVAVLFEHGFDFVKDDGTLRRDIIKVDAGCLDHLQEYRQLPPYKPPT